MKIASTGVCHSDLSLSNGTLPQRFPAVLGHEASGTVLEVGEDVSDVAVGDSVILLWNPSCGSCWFCQAGDRHLCAHASDGARRPLALDADGATVWAGLGVAGFSEQTVVPAASVQRIEGIRPDQAAMLGCASVTGVGAAVNSARVTVGESVAVTGLGGVGLSAVQGALLSGASQVLAIDRSSERLALAQDLGAIPVQADGEALARIRGMTGNRGVDAAIDCVGASATIRQSWDMTRRGGRTVVVGIGRKEDYVAFSPLELFHSSRSLIGCVAGGSDPRTDYPRLLDWVKAGTLVTDGLITDRLGLGGVEEAFEKMQSASGGRTVIDPALP
ncbi:alcohol dehydrogenase [Sinomonas atrocyanea]|nr:alcohol dehydrogenase [Sinomonas atrocyanea]GGG61237.1 alcohol dehydrogenase [Sinomonas atrocyanea]